MEVCPENTKMNINGNILVTGSSGMVGTALLKKLKKKGYNHLLLPDSKELDLRNQKRVENYFEINKPEYVFHIAAKVGGIAANITSPAEFLYDNLAIETNVIESARKNLVKKLLFLGSSCIYPRDCPQPMKEEYLLTGKLEPTNEGYALAKICGLKMCEYYNKQYGTDFISLMPPNIYGINDHFQSEKSHVISALITKFYHAKKNELDSVEVWGTGISKREFLFVEDVTDAMVYFMENHSAKETGPFVNIGSEEDISIKDLAFLIKDMIGYTGELKFNTTKPDGMPKKLLDSSKAADLGWKAKTNLKEGLRKTIDWYVKQQV
jgi:GDP-L-fucose synthase